MKKNIIRKPFLCFFLQRTVLEGWEIRKRASSPAENKKKKVKKATSLSRIPETNSDDDKAKHKDPPHNVMGSL